RADAAQSPVHLTQPSDDPRNDDDLAAEAAEEAFGLVQPLPGEQDVLAVPHHERVAAGSANNVADVVPGDRCQYGDHADSDDVEPPGARVDRGGDQDRLPGPWHPD